MTRKLSQQKSFSSYCTFTTLTNALAICNLCKLSLVAHTKRADVGATRLAIEWDNAEALHASSNAALDLVVPAPIELKRLGLLHVVTQSRSMLL